MRWKNVRIPTENLEINRIADTKAPQISYLDGNAIEEEKIWDLNSGGCGKTTNGWRGAKLSSFPKNGCTINNGIITVEASDGKEARNGRDIITVEKFRKF